MLLKVRSQQAVVGIAAQGEGSPPPYSTPWGETTRLETTWEGATHISFERENVVKSQRGATGQAKSVVRRRGFYLSKGFEVRRQPPPNTR